MAKVERVETRGDVIADHERRIRALEGTVARLTGAFTATTGTAAPASSESAETYRVTVRGTVLTVTGTPPTRFAVWPQHGTPGAIRHMSDQTGTFIYDYRSHAGAPPTDGTTKTYDVGLAPNVSAIAPRFTVTVTVPEAAERTFHDGKIPRT